MKERKKCPECGHYVMELKGMMDGLCPHCFKKSLRAAREKYFEEMG